MTTWELFGAAWLAGWLLAALLGLSGVLVVARGQAFAGLAVAQVATAGLAVGLWLGLADAHAHGWTTVVPGVIAVACAIAAALAADRLAARSAQEAALASAWLFLAGSSASLLLLADRAHGLAEVQRLLASSLLGATAIDAAVFAGLLLIAVIAAWRWRDALLVLALDPAFASAVGMHRRRWDLLLAAWLGLVLGLGLRCAGMLYVVGCLVLPVLAARPWLRTTRALLLAAPLVALVAAVTGTGLAHQGDLPPAQVVVALLAAVAAVGWPIGRWRSHKPGGSGG